MLCWGGMWTQGYPLVQGVEYCSTNDSMIGKIKEKLSVDCLFNDEYLLQMRCVAHILNLIVMIGLDVIKHAIDNVRDSVVFWIASPKRIEGLRMFVDK